MKLKFLINELNENENEILKQGLGNKRELYEGVSKRKFTFSVEGLKIDRT